MASFRLMQELTRCEWATGPEMIQYHDEHWGVPVHDDGVLFEMLTLEGAQAGLSWSTILKRRSGYFAAFDGFDPEKVSCYDEAKIASLMADPGIIRNKAKILSTISNARAILEIRKQFGSFDAYLWKFVDGRPIRNNWSDIHELPAKTSLSDAMSKDLQSKGFRFVGSTICYAFMQAVGLINDHTLTCFRHKDL